MPRTSWKSFGRNAKGNVAVIMGLSVIPLALAGGIAIDYNVAFDARTEMQQAADAAALFAATSSEKGDRTPIANQAFDNNFTKGTGVVITSRSLVPTALPGNKGTLYAYTVTASVPTRFMKIIGTDKMSISSRSTSVVEPAHIELTMVLDSTGSMGRNGRMSALKNAAKNLVDKLSSPTVKIAIVPFDTQVNLDGVIGINGTVGTAPNPFDAAIDCATISDANDRQACLNAVRNTGTPPPYSISVETSTTTVGDPPVTTEINTYHYADRTAVKITRVKQPPAADVVITDFSPDDGASWLSSQGPVTSKPNKKVSANNDLLLAPDAPWYGCVIDREQPTDTTAVAPAAANPKTLYPKAACATPDLAPVMGLSTNKSALLAKINSLQPSGNTNITIGMQWGMEAMTASAPLTNSSTVMVPGLKRHIILVTDGDNTQNRWTTKSDDIDKRTELACAYAKSMDITVHTIRLQEGNATLLGKCASKPENFYNVANASGLEEAFEDILEKISNVRLTE